MPLFNHNGNTLIVAEEYIYFESLELSTIHRRSHILHHKNFDKKKSTRKLLVWESVVGINSLSFLYYN